MGCSQFWRGKSIASFIIRPSEVGHFDGVQGKGREEEVPKDSFILHASVHGETRGENVGQKQLLEKARERIMKANSRRLSS